jgi:PhnB protein
MAANYAPEGYRTVTPYLIVPGVDGLIEFLQRAFDAELVGRYPRPDGTVMHAAVRLGDSLVEMGEPGGESTPRPGTIHLYVEDCDAVHARAVEAGGASLMEPSDQFYGDREAGVEDAFGNHWYIATHIRDVSAEEIEKHAEPVPSL